MLMGSFWEKQFGVVVDGSSCRTSTVAQKNVPILCHFEEIRELWDIKKESGKVPVRWMKGHALGNPKLLWSCDLIAMEARYRHFKMTCHWDTYLTLHVSIIISYIT